MDRVTLIWIFTLVSIFLTGCGRRADTDTAKQSVVLYTSVDESFVRPLIDDFTKRTGIAVTLVTDSEASKTVGLAEKVLAEKDHPRGDVYWGNEPFHTIQLAEAGALAPYSSAGAADILPQWNDESHFYQTIGLRARMIVVSARPDDRDLVADIHGVKDLLSPKLRGRIGMSNPGFGTATGQVAAWYLLWGEDATNTFLRGLRDNNVLLLGGNSAVVDQVASGALAAGLTDNDDIANGKADGQPVDAVVPDQQDQGTLLIPTTIGLVANAPNESGAKTLIDFLTTSQVEKTLIDARFLAYSARTSASSVKAMKIDYVKVAHRLPSAVKDSLTILQNR